MPFPPYATNLEKLKVAFSLMSEVYTELTRELDFNADKTELVDAIRALDRFITTGLADKCRNCGAPLEKCGPELWEQGKKCCPECTHTED